MGAYELLVEFEEEGFIHCEDCGESLEPDCPKCGECGWVNPLLKEGMI